MIIFYSPLCLSNDDNYNNKIIEQKDNLNQIQKQIKTLKNDLAIGDGPFWQFEGRKKMIKI